MAIDRMLRIWTATLRRPGGPDWTVPLTLPAPVGVGADADTVADRLASAIREHWMVEGEVGAIVAADLASASPVAIAVDLPAVDALRPAMNLPFVGVSAPTGDGVTIWLPAIDVVAWGADDAAAQDAAVEAARSWIAREGARDDPRLLAVATGWRGVEVRVVDELLEWHTISERRAIQEKRGAAKDPRLQRATDRLPPQTCVHLDAPRAALVRALEAGRGVVLVGPRGAGKTCLVADVAVGRLGEALRTTSAARLEVALTDEGDWQAALGELCAEIVRFGKWLHVASFADLFEVGRYVGNPTSIGEALRPHLTRGLLLIGECTAEELAAIEARYPGIVEHLTRVDVPAPGDEQLARIARAATADVARPDAVDEAIRLQRRFQPYSGYPGVTLRLLDSLARDARPVTRARVVRRFSEDSGIPAAFVDPDTPLPADLLRERVAGALFGQPEASEALLDVLVAVKADVAPRGRPVASLLFTGPTGVGKTEAARALATVLFGDRDRMVRFDASEFATPAAVARLVASPEAHGEGLLTGAVRRQPFSVVLIDEVEKAHPDLFDLLLQVLGEGRLTDHRGRTADFCSAIVVLTSNLGVELSQRGKVGVGRGPDDLADDLRAAVHRAFRPELVNRFDRIIPFAPLSRDAVVRVLDRELAALARHPALKERGATFTISDEARDWLATRGNDPMRGARPLQRLLRDTVAAGLAVAISAAPEHEKPRFEVVIDGGISVRPLPAPTVKEESGGGLTRGRREVDGVLAGDTAGDLASRVAMGERRARIAAEAPGPDGAEILADLRALRAPLDALRSWRDALIAREARALEIEISGGAPEVEAVADRAFALCRDLYDAMHPGHRVAFVGGWTPAPDAQPVPAVAEWARGLREAAEAQGYRVFSRTLWAVPGQSDVAFVAAAERPKGALRWLGAELWIEGPLAFLWARPVEGLYEAPGKHRVRVGVASAPGLRPPCCQHDDHAIVDVADAAPARAALPDVWTPRRPEDLLRKSAYDGKPRPWPPSTDELGGLLLAHLRGQS